MSAGALIAALLLPPLGVRLAGGSARAFWTACALTVLGFVPGVAFALAKVLSGPVDRPAAA